MLSNPPNGIEEKCEESEPIILGIDLGGTKILTAVVTTRGNILSKDYCVTPVAGGKEAVIRAILKSGDRALKQADMKVAELRAIGVGVAGLSNPETGILFTSPNLPGLRDVPLGDIIEKGFGKKTFLINDADAAALGEFYFGAGRGTRNFIYVTLSTGIGGGIIIDGKLYTGATGMAGEVGHITIDDDGPLCSCGNRGCWESLASGTALARETRREIELGARTSILSCAGGDVDKVTAEVVQKAAEAGDALAKRLISRTACYVGVGLASLINLFNPELIVIGGGLSNMGDMLLAPAYQVAENRAFKQSYGAVRFARAELGQNSGVLGVAVFALQQMERLNNVP